MCFKKKTKAESNLNDRELINKNSALIDALVALNKNEEFEVELKNVKETLKYLIPSTESKIYNADKKIAGIIGDIKIALNKASDSEPNKKAEMLMRDLKVAIAERNALLSEVG